MPEFLDTQEAIGLYALCVLRKRLEAEINFPDWARSNAGTQTMRAARAKFPGVKTRKQALAAVNAALRAAGM